MSIFFQKVQKQVFWNFDFWSSSRGKKTATICMNASTSIIKNERISLSANQYCALLVNLLVTLRQSD